MDICRQSGTFATGWTSIDISWSPKAHCSHIRVHSFLKNWRIIALQCCIAFCHTTMQIDYNYIFPPSWASVPSHPSKLSQSTRLGSLHHKAAASSYLTRGSVYMSMSLSQFDPPSPPHTVAASLFSTSASPFSPCRGFTPGVVHSIGFNKHIMTCIYHYIVQSSFTVLKILCGPSLHPSPPSHPWQPLIFFTVSVTLPFPECLIVGILKDVALSDWGLSLSNMRLRLPCVFSQLDRAHLFCTE